MSYRKKISLFAILGVALLLFNPPIVHIFNRPSTVVGFPLLYFYLFGVWALLIGLLYQLFRKNDLPDE